MNHVEITKENIDKQFINAVDYFGLYIPNLLSFYALFTKRVNNDIDTIRICVKTDVTPVLEYNEQWLVDCDRSVFVFILSVELYRFILHHCTHRALHGPNAYKASTATCNSKELQFFLANAPEELAKYVRNTTWNRDIIEKELGKKIPDGEYYYESVFNLLNQQMEQQLQQQEQESAKQPKNGKKNKSESSSGDGEGDQNEQENEKGTNSRGDQDQDGSEGQDSEDQDGQEGDSESKSRGTDGDGSDEERASDGGESSEGSQESDDEGDSDSDSSSGKGRGTGRNSANPGSDVQGSKQKGKSSREKEAFDDWNHSGEENTQEWGANNIVDEMIRDVVENKCKVTGWGKLSGEQVEEIMLKNKRKVNITPIIAGFGATVRCRKRVSTRLRLNKRYEYLPGYRTDRKTKMLFAIDSSGSMSDSDIRKGCEILHNFYKKTEIDLAFWDAQMVKPQKLKRNFQKVTAPGRGGTDPACIGEYLKKHNMHYDGVVIFTDCYWEWEENNLGSHIFVISSEKEYTVPNFVKHHASIQQLTHVFDDEE